MNQYSQNMSTADAKATMPTQDMPYFDGENHTTTHPKDSYIQISAKHETTNENSNSNDQQLNSIIGLIFELKKQIKHLEQKIDASLPPSKLPEGMIGTKAAMNILGYKDTNSFLAAARRRKIFHVRVNARKFCWSPAAIETWKRERGIGRPPESL